MKRIKFWCVALVLVTATMLLGMPQNAKAAANPPNVIETRVGPYQCVAIPGVTKVIVRQLVPSEKEIDYKVYWNGNERATYEYCYVYGGGDEYTLKPGETQTHTPSWPAGRRVEITNLSRASGDYSRVLVVQGVKMGSAKMGELLKDTDIPGYDIGKYQTQTASECSSLCEDNEKCCAMTWNVNSGACYLKRNPSNQVRNPDGISAVKESCPR